MAIAKVSEYTGAAVISGSAIQAPLGLPLRVQTVTFTSGVDATTNPTGADCGLVKIVVDTDCYWTGGALDTVEATSSDGMMMAGSTEFYVPRGQFYLSFLAKT